MTPTRRQILFTALGAAALGGALLAQEDARAQMFFVERGVAIRGTDPVAYFTKARPVRDSREHAFD